MKNKVYWRRKYCLIETDALMSCCRQYQCCLCKWIDEISHIWTKRQNKETEILHWIWYKESHIYFCYGVNSNCANIFIVSFFKSQHQNLVSSLFILDVDGMILCFQIAGLSCCVHFVLIAGGPSHAPTWFKLTFHESTVSVTKLGDSEAVNPWIHRWITQSQSTCPVVSHAKIIFSKGRAQVKQRKPTDRKNYDNNGYRDCHATLYHMLGWCAPPWLSTPAF